MLHAIMKLCDTPSFELTASCVTRLYSLQALLDDDPRSYRTTVSAELDEATYSTSIQLIQSSVCPPWTKDQQNTILTKFGNFVWALFKQRRLFMRDDGTVGSLSDTQEVFCY